MRSFFIFFVMTGIILANASAAYAQTDATTTASTSTPVPERALEARDNAAVMREAKRLELQARLQERVTNLTANISNRFDTVIDRLQNISDRLNTRMNKLDEAGIDTSAARTSHAAAEAAIDTARGHMADIDEAVIEAIGSQTPLAAWREVRTKYTSAKDTIKLAHTELRNTVRALKGAPAMPAATTTEPLPN